MTMLFDGAVDSSADMDRFSAQAVTAVRQCAEQRGALTREEAEFLFLMDRSGHIGGKGWLEAAVRAVRDHVVFHAAPEGDVSEAQADWLVGMVGDRPTAFGSAVVFAVVRASDNPPARLTELAMRAAVGRCLLV